MLKYFSITFFIFLHLLSFSQSDSIQIFGHRGCRSIYPENSIVGFKYAIANGVTGIEWDVVVNKDKQLVISHESYFKKDYCLMPDGSEIKNEKASNIYTMSQDEIESYDCGSKTYDKFPDQLKLKTHKPLLQEVFKELDLSNVTILFEIKSKPKDDLIFHPEPKEYVDIILKEIENFEFKQNIIFMSFDPRILNELYVKDPTFRCVYLTYLPFRSTLKFLRQLNFSPYALGMFYPTINKRKVSKLHEKGIKIFAWTVNDPKQILKLEQNGVDGIITDYPLK